VHDLAQHVTPEAIRSEQVQRVTGLCWTYQPKTRRQESEHSIRRPWRKEAHPDLCFRILHKDAPQRRRIHCGLVIIYIWIPAQTPAIVSVEQVQLLRGCVQIQGIRQRRVTRGKEGRKERDDIDNDDDDGTDHSELVLPKAPAHQLPLGGHKDARFALLCHRSAAGACMLAVIGR